MIPVKLTAITYEQARLEYFKSQLRHIENRMNWWMNPANTKRHPGWMIEDKLHELGDQASFYRDAINATRQNKEENHE